MESEVSLPYSQVPATCSYPEPDRVQSISPGPRHLFIFPNYVSLYGDDL